MATKRISKSRERKRRAQPLHSKATVDISTGEGHGPFSTGLRKRAGRVTGEVLEGARFVSADLRMVSQDLGRLGAMMAKTGADLTEAISRVAASALGKKTALQDGYVSARKRAGPRPEERGRGAKNGHAHESEKRVAENGGEKRRKHPPRAGRRRAAAPQPEAMAPTHPHPARHKGPAARSSGEKSVPGSVGQDPKWGA